MKWDFCIERFKYALFILQAAVPNERSKRDDSSSESDVSSSESDVTSSESDSATSIDECALVSNFIAFDLEMVPGFPQSFQLLLNFSILFDIDILNKTAPAFLALLTSAPGLFADISLAIDLASDRIVIPPPFFINADVIDAVNSLTALAPEFVALVNDSCKISLNEQQADNVTQIFNVVLPIFFILSSECTLFNRTLIEQAINAANAENATSLVEALNSATIGEFTLFTDRLLVAVSLFLPDNPESLPTVRDEFLFIINDFCGIPPLSDVALMQLDEYLASLLLENKE